jgi:hypothetical protein
MITGMDRGVGLVDAMAFCLSVSAYQWPSAIAGICPRSLSSLIVFTESAESTQVTKTSEDRSADFSAETVP